MHRVIAGCNLWGLLFLGTAFVLALTGSRHHLGFSIFAVLFAMLAQCAIFALFMGASKLLKEHVELFDLPSSLVERTNQLMIPLFRWASVGSMSLLLLAILGGLAASHDIGPWWHGGFGLICMVLLVIAVRQEIPHLEAMHHVLADMESAVPERPADAPPPRLEQPDLRARALVYVGSTTLALIVGYKYISGISVPPSLFVITVTFSILCLGLALYLRLRRHPA